MYLELWIRNSLIRGQTITTNSNAVCESLILILDIIDSEAKPGHEAPGMVKKGPRIVIYMRFVTY